MSPFKQITDGIKNSAEYKEKSSLARYLCTLLAHQKKSVNAEDSALLRNFALYELQKLISVIPAAENYKEKDGIFAYEDALLGVLMLSDNTPERLSAEQADVIRQIVSLVQKERVPESGIEELFKLEKIEERDIEKVLETVKSLTDEYQRGMLYQGLNEHNHDDEFNKFTAEAKEALAEYTADDVARFISDGGDPDRIKSMEYAADVCKHYADGRLLDGLEKVMALKYDNVRYYAAETLLEEGRKIPTATVNEMAGNPEYASLLYGLLKKHGKESMFPTEYSSTEYLAKSDLTHWLTYPTELGKQPDEIELLGVAKVKGETFHIFKYRSDSDTLSDDLHGQWLIGWSGDKGGTFSNFDRLSDFEKKNPEKTLKNIVKKLLK